MACHIQVIPSKINSQILIKTMEARRQQNDISKVLKEAFKQELYIQQTITQNGIF